MSDEYPAFPLTLNDEPFGTVKFFRLSDEIESEKEFGSSAPLMQFRRFQMTLDREATTGLGKDYKVDLGDRVLRLEVFESWMGQDGWEASGKVWVR